LKEDKDELLTESPGNMFHSDIACGKNFSGFIHHSDGLLVI